MRRNVQGTHRALAVLATLLIASPALAKTRIGTVVVVDGQFILTAKYYGEHRLTGVSDDQDHVLRSLAVAGEEVYLEGTPRTDGDFEVSEIKHLRRVEREYQISERAGLLLARDTSGVERVVVMGRATLARQALGRVVVVDGYKTETMLIVMAVKVSVASYTKSTATAHGETIEGADTGWLHALSGNFWATRKVIDDIEVREFDSKKRKGFVESKELRWGSAPSMEDTANEVAASHRDLSGALGGLDDSLGDLNGSLDRLNESLIGLNKALSGLDESLIGLNETLEEVNGSLDEVNGTQNAKKNQRGALGALDW